MEQFTLRDDTSSLVLILFTMARNYCFRVFDPFALTQSFRTILSMKKRDWVEA